jgi:hypothetical protein
MKLPFTIEQFLGVFRQYNENIYPLQFLFYLLAFLIIILIAKKDCVLGADHFPGYGIPLAMDGPGLSFEIFYFYQ